MTKIALVTGANKGIGFETARLLGERGYTVVIGARDEQRGREAAAKLNARFVQLDVTDQRSIENAAKEFDRLDVLVNNAGIGLWDGPPSQSDMDKVRQVFDTNLFGVIAVTNAMLPLLREAPEARVVNVSSEVGSMTLAQDRNSPLWPLIQLAYPASKTALNMVTVQYAKEFDGTSVKFNAVSPGYCATDLTNHEGHRTAEQGAMIAVQMATLPADGPTGTFVADDGPITW